jgi:hypothetical protein
MKHTSVAVIQHPAETQMTKSKAKTDLQEQIRLRAYELHEQRGRVGQELDDWLQAESEMTQQKTVV